MVSSRRHNPNSDRQHNRPTAPCPYLAPKTERALLYHTGLLCAYRSNKAFVSKDVVAGCDDPSDVATRHRGTGLGGITGRVGTGTHMQRTKALAATRLLPDNYQTATPLPEQTPLTHSTHTLRRPESCAHVQLRRMRDLVPRAFID